MSSLLGAGPHHPASERIEIVTNVNLPISPVSMDKLLDSSALSKYALKEPGWSSIEQYLVGCNSIELALKETSNALWKKIIRKEVDIGSAKRIVRVLSETIWFLEQCKYLERALEIATTHQLTVYDALFLACAEVESQILVSCDKRQLVVAEALGIKIIRV